MKTECFIQCWSFKPKNFLNKVCVPHLHTHNFKLVLEDLNWIWKFQFVLVAYYINNLILTAFCRLCRGWKGFRVKSWNLVNFLLCFLLLTFTLIFYLTLWHLIVFFLGSKSIFIKKTVLVLSGPMMLLRSTNQILARIVIKFSKWRFLNLKREILCRLILKVIWHVLPL